MSDDMRRIMEKFIPTSWVTNTLLLILVAAISYGIFLAVMVGTNQPEPEHPPVVVPTSPGVQA